MRLLKRKKLLTIGVMLLALTAFHGAAVYADHDGDHESYEERQLWQESPGSYGEYQKEDYEEGEYDDDRNSSGQTEGTYPGAAGYNQGTSAQAVLLDGQPVSFRFPGSMLQTDMIVAVSQGEVLVPAEVVLDGLQIPYVIYSKGDILELFANGHHVIFHTDKNTIYVDGLKSFLPAAPFYRNALYYIPINVLADVMGDKLEWDPNTNLLQMRKGG
ncbi:stalk domain-containing protein [Ferviditalea candida]|uniref:Stalk domain-containing protein n=1 Tax=Ferviditalea candida TaxID=3108399 RepID=A0ABU5ZM66_9BACL|nr:stalk domain-containing protein [Paenibacillaceae bacterium T2]